MCREKRPGIDVTPDFPRERVLSTLSSRREDRVCCMLCSRLDVWCLVPIPASFQTVKIDNGRFTVSILPVGRLGCEAT
jgi:hypothetical protein